MCMKLLLISLLLALVFAKDEDLEFFKNENAELKEVNGELREALIMLNAGNEKGKGKGKGKGEAAPPNKKELDEDEPGLELQVGAIGKCPSGWTQKTRSCCKNGSNVCAMKDGSYVYCWTGHLVQGRRGPSNGCGSEHADFPWWVQKAFTAELGSVCDRHDNCYSHCRTSQQTCDGNWYRDAKKACWDTYGNCSKRWWSCALNWIVAGGPLAWCHARIALMHDGMTKNTAWMESMGQSCKCVRKKSSWGR